MPLTLAVSALTQTEKSQFIAVLKGRAQDLSCAWTLFWEPADFPPKVDAVIYCPKRSDSKTLAEQLVSKGSLPIAALLPQDSTASEVPLFVRMPFKPQEVVETLNAAAKRLLAEKPFGDLSADSDLSVDVINETLSFPLAVALHRVFRSGLITADIVKIKKNESAREIICWPELELYWSYESEAFVSSDSEGSYSIHPAVKPKETLDAKGSTVRKVEGLLWRTGLMGFAPGALFPGLMWNMPLELLFWPDIPYSLRHESAVRLIRRLSLSPASMDVLFEESHLSRPKITAFVNALLVSGAVRKASTLAVHLQTKFDSVEEDIFTHSLALRVFEKLDQLLPGDFK